MTALLEMNTSPAELDQAPSAKPPMRFTYPSGSRPLSGYTIKRGVGRGGFGEVYFAVSDAGKEVALKLIRRNLEVELRGVTHCLNLKHPNLVALYDIRTDEHDDRWVVMEFVSGESLEDLIDRYPEGMPKENALHWFEGICAAVAYLHDHGIVHRDLKPANIFLDDGVIKIGDYGLSKFISCSRRSGQTESVGTVHYMAPEIANGRYGREIDAYALGIILYEMLTGRVPFEGESVGEVLMKHLTAEPKLDVLEEPFRSVVQGAMAKDPERRINNASEMIALLRGVPYTPAPVAPLVGERSPERSEEAPKAAAAQVAYQPQELAGATAPKYPRVAAAKDFLLREPEPVFAATQSVVRGMAREINWPGLSGWQRFGVVAMGVFAAIVMIILFVPVIIAFVAAVIYCAYRVVRGVVRGAVSHGEVSPTQRSGAPPMAASALAGPSYAAAVEPAWAATTLAANPAAAAKSTDKRPWRRRAGAGWRQAAYHELSARSARERFSSVLGSMLSASVVATVAATLGCLLAAPAAWVELALWTSVVATLASWAVIVPSQLVEGHMEDHAPLRFINLVLGAAVGLAAWGFAQQLYLHVPMSDDFTISAHESLMVNMFHWDSAWFESYAHSASMMPPGVFAGYFALLFVVLRWWRNAEWTRSSRVGVWSIAWCCFVAWALTFIWWFPQPVGLFLAGIVAFSVQLASPWLSPSRRRELAQKAA